MGMKQLCNMCNYKDSFIPFMTAVSHFKTNLINFLAETLLARKSAERPHFLSRSPSADGRTHSLRPRIRPSRPSEPIHESLSAVIYGQKILVVIHLLIDVDFITLDAFR
jgi:hypothetical protein